MSSNNQQLVPHDTPKSQSRIRTNIVLLQPLTFYIPDDDDCVPYAIILGRHTIATARGCKRALLSGYFSSLCAVLPDLANPAKKIMKNLGYQAEEIAVPSKDDRMDIAIPRPQHLKLEIIKFAQMVFLPFQHTFDGNVNVFWKAVAEDAGVKDLSSSMMCSVDDMKTISDALLLSGLKGELRTSIASSLRELAATSSPFGRIISAAMGKKLWTKDGSQISLYKLKD